MREKRERSGHHAPRDDATETPLGTWSELADGEKDRVERWNPLPDDDPLQRPGVHLLFVTRDTAPASEGTWEATDQTTTAAASTTMIRQGDVLLVRVPSLPEGISLERIDGSRVVLARSEATGHAHVVHGEGARLFASAGSRYLTVECAAILTHEEHDPIDVPAGVWEVRQQRQFTVERAARHAWTDVVD